MIGLPWPGIDEDQLRAWAASVRGFAEDICDSSSQTNHAMRELAEESRSSVLGGLAREYERHHRLITSLHGPMDDFAGILDAAADAVVAQKTAVITAATVLGGAVAATQGEALVTLGLAEAEVPLEVAAARTAVNLALKDLAAVIEGRLINWGARLLSDVIGRSIAALADDAGSLRMEAQGLKAGYETILRAADQLRRSADDAEELGCRAHAENAGRDLEDNSGGGGWEEVINMLGQALLEVAEDLFTSLPGAIAMARRAIVATLEKFASRLRAADEEGDAAPGTDVTAVAPVTSETPRSQPAPSSADGGRASPELDEKLRDAVHERYRDIVVNDGPAHQSNKERGPVLTGAMDRLTGDIEFGQNGGRFPEPLHPRLAERINEIPAESLYPGSSGVHSEVHALNRLLWKREAAGRPTAIDGSFSFYSVRLKGSAKGEKIARCDSCAHLTNGAEDLAGPR